VNNPQKFVSKNTKWEFNIEKANKLLDDAGWKKGADGIREKDGKKLKYVFQTSINAPRQKNQAIIKQACQKAGIEVELKSVVASVFFSSDAANPDTYPHFYCDMEMYQTTMPQADPQFFMNQFTSWEAATKENKWQGRNISRWQNKDYDDVFRQAQRELDAVKRAAMFIKLNDLVVGDHYILPEINRPRPTALKTGLVPHESGWDNDLWQIANWYRED
jgi:peptide/nickel transport system substrate-binding protein